MSAKRRRIRRVLRNAEYGMARLLDFAGVESKARRRRTHVQIDEEVACAIAADWEAVGGDMRTALNTFAPEVAATQTQTIALVPRRSNSTPPISN